MSSYRARVEQILEAGTSLGELVSVLAYGGDVSLFVERLEAEHLPSALAWELEQEDDAPLPPPQAAWRLLLIFPLEEPTPPARKAALTSAG